MAILSQAVLNALIVFSAALSPQLLVRHFDLGSVLSVAFDNPKFIPSSGVVNPYQSATIEGQVGDGVSVPPVVQSFIDAYKDGKINESLPVYYDPLLKLIN